MKKGDLIKFNFHGFGLVSQEETKIVSITKKYITIDEGEPFYKFDRNTGKCINEESPFGCYRTISKKYLKI